MLFLSLILFSICNAGSPFLIRPAENKDVDALYTLIRELAAFEGQELSTLPVTKENLTTYGLCEASYFKAELVEIESEIVGCAIYYYGFSSYQGSPFLYLDVLYIKPEKRGLGLGTGLLKKLALYAKEQNCCRMEWQAFDWNDQAICFYKRLGGELREDLKLIRMEKDSYLKLITDR